jgi:glutamine synthetase
MSGLEVEFHVFKVTDPHMKPEHSGQPGTPPDVELLSHGYQYLTELRYDAVDGVMEMLRRGIDGLALPVRSLEIEYGPSQFEFTFAPATGIKSADDMILFRSAVKQICQRNGYYATFMCRPRIPNVVSSGWHLHQSLVYLAAAPMSSCRRSRARRSRSPVSAISRGCCFRAARRTWKRTGMAGKQAAACSSIPTAITSRWL